MFVATDTNLQSAEFVCLVSRKKSKALWRSTLFVCGAQAELLLAGSYLSNKGRKVCRFLCRNRAVPEPACDLWNMLIRLVPPHDRSDVNKRCA